MFMLGVGGGGGGGKQNELKNKQKTPYFSHMQIASSTRS